MDRKVLYEGRYKRLVEKDGWEFVERVNCAGAVVILAMTDQEEILLVEQNRIPLGKQVIELPAGLASDTDEHKEESFADAARRELLEETGFKASEMKLFFMGPQMAAMSGDMMRIFRATGLSKVNSGGGDSSETITPHVVPIDDADRWIAEKQEAGCLIDAKVFTGLYFLTRELRK